MLATVELWPQLITNDDRIKTFGRFGRFTDAKPSIWTLTETLASLKLSSVDNNCFFWISSPVDEIDLTFIDSYLDSIMVPAR